MTNHLLSGQTFPHLEVPRVGGGILNVAKFDPPFMTLLNIYRGLHCPRCKRQLRDFVDHRADFEKLGADVVSISTDSRERAEQAIEEWGLGDMAVGYGLTIQDARGLGLNISESIREGEPAYFAEPAVFFIRKDGVLWGSSINSFPFLRPSAEQLLDAVQVAKERDYPPRGNVAA